MSKSFIDWIKSMARLTDEQIPLVVANSLNSVAKTVETDSRNNVISKMTLRNNYTLKSIRSDLARVKKNWNNQYSRTGSISPYMDEQDAGGFRLPKKGRSAVRHLLAARAGNKKSRVKPRFKAGTALTDKQFSGTPKGGNRPAGVWERRNNNKKLVPLRIFEEKVEIKATNWHTQAVKKYGTRAALEKAYIKEANKIIRGEA